MLLVNKSTLKLVNEVTFRKSYPNISFPAILSNETLRPYEHAIIEDVAAPICDADERLIATDTCYEIDNRYYINYNKVKMSDSDIDSHSTSIRQLRNQLLSESDWTQGKDIPDAMSAAWQPYRQALRDLPNQTGFPFNVEWPNQP